MPKEVYYLTKEQYKTKSKESNTNEIIIKTPVILSSLRFDETPPISHEPHPENSKMQSVMMQGGSLNEWMCDRIDGS